MSFDSLFVFEHPVVLRDDVGLRVLVMVAHSLKDALDIDCLDRLLDHLCTFLRVLRSLFRGHGFGWSRVIGVVAHVEAHRSALRSQRKQVVYAWISRMRGHWLRKIQGYVLDP